MPSCITLCSGPLSNLSKCTQTALSRTSMYGVKAEVNMKSTYWYSRVLILCETFCYQIFDIFDRAILQRTVPDLHGAGAIWKWRMRNTGTMLR